MINLKGEQAMKIQLNQQDREIDESHVHNLEEILLNAIAEHVKPGHEVTTIRLNGGLYTEESPRDAAGVQLSDIHTLEIETAAREHVARQFLEYGVGQLGVMMQAAERISELFRIGDEGEANKHLAEFLESLRLLMEMLVKGEEILQADLSAVPFRGGTLEAGLQQLSEMMDRMIRVQEGEDWMVLADLVEYELVPLLNGWKEVLPALGAKVQ